MLGGRLIKAGAGRLTFETPAAFPATIDVTAGDLQVGDAVVPAAAVGPVVERYLYGERTESPER